MSARHEFVGVPAAGAPSQGLSFDLQGACSTLRTLLAAHDAQALDASTAQVSLRAVGAVMLRDWAEAPGPAGSDGSLLFGVALLRLAEQGLWVASAAGRTEPPSECIDVVRRALELLEAEHSRALSTPARGLAS